MNRCVVVVECIIESDGKFLLIKRPAGVHAGGLWAFPGGKIEARDAGVGQDILMNAIKREVLEEVGLELLDPVHYVTSSYFVDSHDNPILDVIFCSRLKDTSNLVKASPREAPQYAWMTEKEIFDHPDMPDWVKRYLTALS